MFDAPFLGRVLLSEAAVIQITGVSDLDHSLCVSGCYSVSRRNCNFRIYSEFDAYSKYIMAFFPTTEKFVAWWGEMGSKWGVNRTVGEIHALFYLSQEPLNAEDIAATLSFSRSNVSAGLRELQNWGLISPVHFRGDRKQYFETIKDPWETFRLILDERKRREIDPAVATLRACVEEAAGSTPADLYTQERLHAMLEFFEVMIPLYDELRRIPPGSVKKLAKLTAKVREVVG